MPLERKLEIVLPDPHPAQVRMEDESKTYNVAVCGRRTGKTEHAKRRGVKRTLRGGRVGWFAPTYKQERPVITWVERNMGGLVIPSLTDRQQHTYEFQGGGAWEFWSLDNANLADSIRGRAYDEVFIDEAGALPELGEIWQEVILPTLLDRNGQAWFLSTPRGFNAFYELYQRGQSRLPEDADWASWQIPTWENPLMTADKIQKMRDNMTASRFAQEIEAIFTSPEGLVLGLDYDGIPLYAVNRNVREQPCTWAECKWRIVGVDPGGSTGDPAGLVAIGVTTDKVLVGPGIAPPNEQHHVYAALSRVGSMAAQDVVAWVRALERAGGAPVDRVFIGETGGDTFTTTVSRFGLPAWKANQTRATGITHLQQLFRTGRLTIPPHLREGLEEEIYAWSFAPKKIGRTGNDPWATVSGSADNHADRMDALRYACMGVLTLYPGGQTFRRTRVGQRGSGVTSYARARRRHVS